MRFIPLVLRNLARNFRRTTLTGISIAVSIFVFAALMSLPGVIQQIMKHESGSLRLITHTSAGLFHEMPHAYVEKIRGVPNVVGAAGELLFMGTLKDPYNPLRSAALDPDEVEKIFPDWLSPETAEQLRKYRDGAVVGANLIRNYRWKIGDMIIMHGTIYPVDLQLRIVGIIKPNSPANGALLFRRDFLDEALGRPGNVNIFWVRVDSARAIPSVIAEIDERLSGSGEIQTETEDVMMSSQLQSFGLIINGAKVLAAIVILTIGLVALNTASMSVRERRSEMAVMRTLGFTRRAIIMLFSAEGLAIGIAGAAIGCALAYLVLHFVMRASDTIGPLAYVLRLPPSVALQSIGVGIVLGMIASIAPAVSATRREIASELRALA